MASVFVCPPLPCSMRGARDEGAGGTAPDATQPEVPASEQQTAFRRWHSYGPGDAQDESPVLGLEAALAQVGMSSYISAVEAWCDAAGAASMAELQDEVEAICLDLALPPPQCRRLRRALAGQVSPGASVSELDILEVLDHWCDGLRVEEDQWQRQSPPLAGFHALLRRSEGPTTDILSTIPGLLDVLVETDLSGVVARAEAWCAETGAAFLAEILEEHESFCAALGIDLVKQEQFRRALEAQVKQEGLGSIPAPAVQIHVRTCGHGKTAGVAQQRRSCTDFSCLAPRSES